MSDQVSQPYNTASNVIVSDLPANVGIMISRLNDLFENENKIYFQQEGASRDFQVNVRNFVDHSFRGG